MHSNQCFIACMKQVFEDILSHKPVFNGSRISVHVLEQHKRRGCFNCYFSTLSKYSVRVSSWNSCFLWESWICEKCCYLKTAPSPVVVLTILCRCFKYINVTEWVLFSNHFVKPANDLMPSKWFEWISVSWNYRKLCLFSYTSLKFVCFAFLELLLKTNISISLRRWKHTFS